jgi:hypothetical protein
VHPSKSTLKVEMEPIPAPLEEMKLFSSYEVT